MKGKSSQKWKYIKDTNKAIVQSPGLKKIYLQLNNVFNRVAYLLETC